MSLLYVIDPPQHWFVLYVVRDAVRLAVSCARTSAIPESDTKVAERKEVKCIPKVDDGVLFS
jgi:hypothetical protein